MSLLAKNHENFLLQELPPNARDIAEFLFNSKTLTFFLQQWQQPTPDIKWLDEKNVTHNLWDNIIRAALIAKLTFIEPHAGLSREQLMFLIQTSCKVIHMPLSDYSLEEIIRQHKQQMPKFTQWLVRMAQELKLQS